jgi:hypothetical protein
LFAGETEFSAPTRSEEVVVDEEIRPELVRILAAIADVGRLTEGLRRLQEARGPIT